MVIADASGLPLALHTDSASPHEVTPVQATLDEIVTVGQPGRIVGDRAHDSVPLDNAPAAQGIGMMAPHRRNRKRKATQDGRPLRRYRRRRKIERLLAWLNTFRRTMARRAGGDNGDNGGESESPSERERNGAQTEEGGVRA